MFYEFYTTKVERKDVIVLKDLEKFKAAGCKITIPKSGRGIKNDDFSTLWSMLSVFDYTPLLR